MSSTHLTFADRNAKSAFLKDYAARAAQNNTSQYVFHFSKLTEGDGQGDGVNVQCGSVELSLDYLAP